MALAVLLPEVLTFNLPVCRSVYARAAFALGVGRTDRGDELNAAACIDAVRTLVSTLGLPASLRALGLTEHSIPQIVQDALDDEVMANTPRLPTADELRSLLHRCL
jgi:alcohol dehydrogenase class IV